MTTVPRHRLNFGLIVSKCEQTFNAPFVSNFAPPLVDKFYRNTHTNTYAQTLKSFPSPCPFRVEWVRTNCVRSSKSYRSNNCNLWCKHSSPRHHLAPCPGAPKSTRWKLLNGVLLPFPHVPTQTHAHRKTEIYKAEMVEEELVVSRVAFAHCIWSY